MFDFQLYKNYIFLAILIIIVIVLLYNYQTKKIVKNMMKKELNKLKKQNYTHTPNNGAQDQESYMDPAIEHQGEEGEPEENF